MPIATAPIVLGSRSPRRRKLLALLVGEDRIIVRPPLDSTEPGFDDVTSIDSLHERLTDIACRKSDDVCSQLRTDGGLAEVAAVLTADTVIVVEQADGRPLVLGQPPEENWQETVRHWFRQHYLGCTHQAVTAICVTPPAGEAQTLVVSTQVRFRADAERWLEWYLSTGEPIGKAGGYGLQGAGSLFVDHIDGSPSNVIGLPLAETAEMLSEFGLHEASPAVL